MLDKAREEDERLNLAHVDLVELDAESITFPDDNFGHTVIPFVMSIVPNLERVMAEVKRVTKTGGGIIIINHFCSKYALFSRMEKILTPAFLGLGWNAGLPIDLFSNHCDLLIVEIAKKSRLDPWFIIRATNKK